ncbi:hypothetical protein CEC48_25405 [Pseudomonas sp. K2I15]|nr:hypothetical protein CEC48_25405 [Pseudomonas sp. K2I15]
MQDEKLIQPLRPSKFTGVAANITNQFIKSIHKFPTGVRGCSIIIGRKMSNMHSIILISIYIREMYSNNICRSPRLRVILTKNSEVAKA